MSENFRVWHRNYVTHSAHGDKPAGTRCDASRDWRQDLIVLKFGEEETVELPGSEWRLTTERSIQVGIITAIEDERALRAALGHDPDFPVESSKNWPSIIALKPKVA